MIRMVLAIATHNKWYVHQMDVMYSFLNGSLEEEAYVRQPPGYEVDGQEDNQHIGESIVWIEAGTHILVQQN